MSFPHRTYCDTLAEARSILNMMTPFNITQSKDILSTLIEECQTYGNRMEAGLHYSKDIETLHQRRKTMKRELNDLTELTTQEGDI